MCVSPMVCLIGRPCMQEARGGKSGCCRSCQETGGMLPGELINVVADVADAAAIHSAGKLTDPAGRCLQSAGKPVGGLLVLAQRPGRLPDRSSSRLRSGCSFVLPAFKFFTRAILSGMLQARGVICQLMAHLRSSGREM